LAVGKTWDDLTTLYKSQRIEELVKQLGTSAGFIVYSEDGGYRNIDEQILRAGYLAGLIVEREQRLYLAKGRSFEDLATSAKKPGVGEEAPILLTKNDFFRILNTIQFADTTDPAFKTYIQMELVSVLRQLERHTKNLSDQEKIDDMLFLLPFDMEIPGIGWLHATTAKLFLGIAYNQPSENSFPGQIQTLYQLKNKLAAVWTDSEILKNLINVTLPRIIDNLEWIAKREGFSDELRAQAIHELLPIEIIIPGIGPVRAKIREILFDNQQANKGIPEKKSTSEETIFKKKQILTNALNTIGAADFVA
jgi:hypothetical protein